MNRFLQVFLAALALGIMSTTARADPIGPNCGSCFGNIIAISGGSVMGSTATTETFRFQLDVDASGFNIAGGGYLNAASIKVFDGNSVQSVSLFSGPSGWSATNGGISSGGCSSNGGGFVCASGGLIAVPTNNLLTWIFDITVTNTAQNPANPLLDSASVKLSFVNYDDSGKLKNIGLTSEDGLQVGETCPPSVCTPQELPEPGALALLAVALLAMGFAHRFARGRS
ncbi:MAG: hypothetical protein U1F10_04035 [Burkholderiales bacterium]